MNIPILFWLLVVASIGGGAIFALRFGKSVVARISANSPHMWRVQRAGQMAGMVAVLPGLFFAVVVGGNFGGALASGFAQRFPESLLVQQCVMGLGIGGGSLCLFSVLVVSTMAAGATFMKVYLARGD
ncbi:MAG: pimeloyl-ACP methyl ester carboxylesterase [Gammaproteobacteria bacterium]|jgi:pimeloyl-ACP methyl ester carboxylesterase